MPSLNKVFLMGNLTRDPEVRQLPSGVAVADLGMAVTRKYRTQDGEGREETCFVKVTVFGRQAETVGQYLHKGSPAFVEGRLKFEEWERDGKKQSRLTVTAERVQFLSGPRRGAEYGDAPSAPSRPMPAAGGHVASDEPVSPADTAHDEPDDLPF